VSGVSVVVTGLGAKTLADVLPGAEKLNDPAKQIETQIPVETAPIAVQIEESAEALPVDILNDLDVPAFMRKKARVNAKAPERG